MQKMFQGKNASSIEGKTIVEVKIHCKCECNRRQCCCTRSKIIKDQVFQERKPRKNKSTTNWEKEEKLKKTMVEIIHWLQKAQTTNKRSSTLIEIWNIMWLGMLDTTPSIKPWKPQEFVVSQSKLI
jgi:hypothetical protein